MDMCPSSSSSSSSHSRFRLSSKEDDKDEFAVGDVILTIVGVLLAVGIFYAVYCIRHMQKRRRDAILSLTPGSPSQNITAVIPRDRDEGKSNWKIEYYEFELGEVLGQGVIGKVSKARWRGLTVVLKEFAYTSKQDQVEQELSQLIRVRHPYLVLFMGIAHPAPDRLCVVAEFMSRGSLFGVLKDKNVKLDWKKRMSMALDTAKAMSYLHCSKPPILHKNLTSTNVMVDKDFVAKVSDYGLGHLRKSTLNTHAHQPFWTAPEVFHKNKHSAASDVYGFGIILWELLTRKTPYEGRFHSNTVKAMKEISGGLRPTVPAG